MSIFEEINSIFEFLFVKQKGMFALWHFLKTMNKSTQFPDVCIPDIRKPIIDRPLLVPIAQPNYYFQPPPKIIIIEYQQPLVQTYFKTIEKSNRKLTD